MITIASVKEGEKYPTKCLIALGKNISQNKTWGYYLLFRSPITKVKDYIDVNTLNTVNGKVSNLYLLRWNSAQRKLFYIKAANPV